MLFCLFVTANIFFFKRIFLQFANLNFSKFPGQSGLLNFDMASNVEYFFEAAQSLDQMRTDCFP